MNLPHSLKLLCAPLLTVAALLPAAGPAQTFPSQDRKSTRLNSSHSDRSRMPSSA